MVGKVLFEPVKLKNMYEPIEYLYNIEARIGVICDATAKSILGHLRWLKGYKTAFGDM